MIKSLLTYFISLPLRTQLCLLALLIALPAIGLIIHTGSIQHNDATRKGFNEARRLVYNIAMTQYDMAGNAAQLMTTLAQIPDIKRHNSTTTNALLRDVNLKSHHFGNIIISDQKGSVWASALPMTKTFSMQKLRTFINVSKTGNFSSGEYVVGTISGKSTIGFGYPILNTNGHFDGVIACNINFDIYDAMLNQQDTPKGIFLSFIDHKGTVIYSNVNRKLIGTDFEKDRFFKMKNGRDRDTFIDFDIEDEKRVVSYRKLQLPGEDSPYIYIRASVPLQGLLEKAKSAQHKSIATLSLYLLAAIALAIPIGNYCFVRRINKLQEASRLLASGDLNVRVFEIVKGGELGELARSFDEMAARLAERELALRRSERELQDLNKELLDRVELETAKRLKHERILARHDRLAAIGEMIGAIAHQWRQPLATLGATVQGIRMAWEEKCIDDEFLKNAESDAQMQLEYMSDTIEDFRNFFNLEKTIERFEIKEKVGEAVLLASPQFANSGVRIDIIDNSADCVLEISGYQNEFKQAVLNLLSNSFDSIIDKRSDIKRLDGAEAFIGQVVICLLVEGENIVVEVRDNGGGIPVEYSDKVFEPYFTSKADKGTGIGLYMAKLIIEESLGGRINFTSGPDGTLFRIEIPREFPEEVEANG